jgi:hypothetical protein
LLQRFVFPTFFEPGKIHSINDLSERPFSAATFGFDACRFEAPEMQKKPQSPNNHGLLRSYLLHPY